jgi:uncharacterized integral membrane protein
LTIMPAASWVRSRAMAVDPLDQSGAEWNQSKDGQPGADRERSRDVAPRAIVALVALVAAVVFVVQNRNRVETTFLFVDATPRLWVVIVVSLLLGALLGQAGALLARRRKKS